jgi:hypothetical protein
MPARKLANPLILAALMVWGGIAIDLVIGTPRARGPFDSASAYWLSLALHLAFIVLVVACAGPARGPRLRWIGDTVALALVLAICALRPYTAAPVLLIVVMAQFTGWLPPRGAVALWVAVNVVLYLMLALGTEMAMPAFQVLLMASFQLFAMGVAWAIRESERARDAVAQVNAATRSACGWRANCTTWPGTSSPR